MFSIDKQFQKNKAEKYIGEIKNNNKTEYLAYDKNLKNNVLKTDNEIIPCMNFCDKREIIYITGKSGSGKSYLTNQLANQYHKQHSDRIIYYVTKVKYEQGDISLDKDLYIFVDITKFLNIIRQDDCPKEDFANSLVIFDDISSVLGSDEKILWYWINLCLEVYRKNNTSLILCNHLPTEYKKTRLMIAEMTKYIVFNNLKTRSDRVLLTYIEMTKQEVADMLKHESRWFCIDTNLGIVITQHSDYKLN